MGVAGGVRRRFTARDDLGDVLSFRSSVGAVGRGDDPGRLDGFILTWSPDHGRTSHHCKNSCSFSDRDC